MTREKIMVVEDEEHISELIGLYLSREGYEVIISQDGQHVFDIVKLHSPDLMILDILLPGTDGIEICRELRREVDIPIIFLSCKSEDSDIILGLGVGGDDYITKPFSPNELVARVKAQLRRNRLTTTSKIPSVIKFPGLEINTLHHAVRINGEPVTLSNKEFQILLQLATHPTQIFSLDQLYEKIWESESLRDTRTVLVHIHNLRKKIEVDPTLPQYIHTVRGVGYTFNIR